MYSADCLSVAVRSFRFLRLCYLTSIWWEQGVLAEEAEEVFLTQYSFLLSFLKVKMVELCLLLHDN